MVSKTRPDGVILVGPVGGGGESWGLPDNGDGDIFLEKLSDT